MATGFTKNDILLISQQSNVQLKWNFLFCILQTKAYYIPHLIREIQINDLTNWATISLSHKTPGRFPVLGEVLPLFYILYVSPSRSPFLDYLLVQRPLISSQPFNSADANFISTQFICIIGFFWFSPHKRAQSQLKINNFLGSQPTTGKDW